jgi:hypothetical protein
MKFDLLHYNNARFHHATITPSDVLQFIWERTKRNFTNFLSLPNRDKAQKSGKMIGKV